MRTPFVLASLMVLTALSGCDQLGIETPTVVAAKREAEGKAVGPPAATPGAPSRTATP